MSLSSVGWTAVMGFSPCQTAAAHSEQKAEPISLILKSLHLIPVCPGNTASHLWVTIGLGPKYISDLLLQYQPTKVDWHKSDNCSHS